MIGKIFSRLTVVEFAGTHKRYGKRWLCQCSCGTTRIVLAYFLKTGHTRSCGCLRKESLSRVTGSNTSRWKGGRVYYGKRAYIWKPDHPRASKKGYIGEHILILEKKLGRFLLFNEVAHHKDKDVTNNDPGNLELMTKGDHSRYHNSGEKCSLAKLTEKQVRGIRAAVGKTQVMLAKEYAISRSNIGSILRRKTWKDLT